jgi:hypothetical protein
MKRFRPRDFRPRGAPLQAELTPEQLVAVQGCCTKVINLIANELEPTGADPLLAFFVLFAAAGMLARFNRYRRGFDGMQPSAKLAWDVGWDIARIEIAIPVDDRGRT